MSPSRTMHIGGADVTYTGSVIEFVVSDGAGEPGARYVCTQYLRDVTPEMRISRPVLFVFNGGPGSSAAWTHLGIGPRRIADADSLTPAMTPPFGLVDNEDSPLDVADLVFIDPPGTGYSRILDESTAEAFYGTEQDARATLELIELWARRNQRENSPRFIAGESYGTLRAARMARLANGGPTRGGATRSTSLNGAIVLGPSFALGEDAWAGDVKSALELTTLVATARYYGTDVAHTDDEVARFARCELLPALAAGADLPEEKRKAVAETMATMLGLDLTTVLSHDLRITARDFATLVLAGQGRHVGTYDSRFSLSADGSGTDPVADDPGMGQYMPQFLGAIEPYLRDELDYVSDDVYRGIAFADVNFRWDYGRESHSTPAKSLDPPPAPFGEFVEALRRDPAFEVLIGIGDYDLVTTRAATEFALTRVRFDRGRVHLRRYASGHMPYLGAEPRAALATDLRSFVTRLARRDGVIPERTDQ